MSMISATVASIEIDSASALTASAAWPGRARLEAAPLGFKGGR
jgi:hypothetical protein